MLGSPVASFTDARHRGEVGADIDRVGDEQQADKEHH